ncbi:MAG: lactonase family protein [Opitutaceae bacterium]|nr:lactonase family protein [Opitutaceae bacterium]
MITAPMVATLLVIGTFREGPGIGLTTARFDPATGTLTAPAFAAEAANPSFLTVAPDGRHVHVCNETWPGNLSTFAVDPTSGALTPVARVPSEGKSPCYIELDRTGRFALVANYSDGVFSVFALDADGRLGARTARVAIPGSSVNKDRQEASHAHCFVTDPSNRFALGVDLGADRIYVHRFDAATGALAPHEPASFAAKPGAGPRHLRFHPDGKFAYVVNELDCTVSVCTWDAERGVLTETQRLSSLPTGFSSANTSAELVVHPSGRTLYVTNRGLDAITTFAIDPATGTLTALDQVPSRGGKPRNLVIHPEGRWLLCANQDGDSIAIFAIDAATGRLTPHGEPVAAKNPGCLRFVPGP